MRELKYPQRSGACIGLDDSNINFVDAEKPLHNAVLPVVAAFQRDALNNGFCLAIASGYRSFSQQLVIWNAKAAGQRPLLDKNEKPLLYSSLSETELMWAILEWSALPGASRHHWGTDFDIYEANLCAGHQLQLTLAETQEGGIFAPFYRWLDGYLTSQAHGLFRPFRAGVGGVAPEPWHVSVAPIAHEFEAAMSIEVLQQQIETADIALKPQILSHLDEIYGRFVAPYLSHSNSV